MESILACGTDYFATAEFPLRVGRSRSHPRPTLENPLHKTDLTGVEHHHDFNELAIVNKGYGIQNLNGIDIPVSAGDIFLLQEQQRHYFHSRQNLEVINVMYEPKQLGLPENELRRMAGYCAIFMLEPSVEKNRKDSVKKRLQLNKDNLLKVESISEQISREVEDSRPGYVPLARAKLIELFVYLSRSYEGQSRAENQSLLRIGNVIGALETNYAKEWKLEELISISNMSKSNLFATFKRATGHTPMNYLTWIRIQRSIEFLRKDTLSITDVAYAVGFNDSNYFSRQFRKITGKSPSAARIRIN